MGCRLCPRACDAARTPADPGWCGARDPAGFVRLGKWMLHPWEEPFLSGTRGAANVFFSGCQLGCCYCQNREISCEHRGRLVSLEALELKAWDFVQQGAHVLCFVTAESQQIQLMPLLRHLKKQNYPLPLVWNGSGYQTVASLRLLEGLIDVYLPDYKYQDPTVSAELSQAADYAIQATAALAEMHRQQPQSQFNSEGILTAGVAIRHLVLPGYSANSLQVLSELARWGWPLTTPLAIMAQYTPGYLTDPQHPAYRRLKRKVTTYEYQQVIDHALTCGFEQVLGQARTSAQSTYRPVFWTEGGLAKNPLANFQAGSADPLRPC